MRGRSCCVGTVFPAVSETTALTEADLKLQRRVLSDGVKGQLSDSRPVSFTSPCRLSHQKAISSPSSFEKSAAHGLSLMKYSTSAR